MVGLTGLGVIHQATSLGGQARHRAGGQAHNPCFAPDGETLAFQSNHEGETGIFAARIDGSNLRRVTPEGLAARHPAWHPSGAVVAFEVESADGGSWLAHWEFARNDLRPLTPPGFRDQHPAWFPDGRRLVFHSNRSGGLHLFAVDVGTGAIEQISRGNARYKHPAVSPGGNLVACVMAAGQAWTVALVEVPSGRLLVKCTENRLPQHPAFAGGTTLVFQDEVCGTTALFALDLEEAGDVQLTAGAAVHKPAVSPDVRRLAFSARLGHGWEIFVAPFVRPASYRRV